MSELITRRKKEINIAISSFGKAHRMIFSAGLYRYVLFYGLLFLGLFFVYLWSAWQLVDVGFDQITHLSQVEQWQEKWPWLKWPIKITQIGVQLIVVYLFTIVYKYVVLILGSPLFAYLSEKTEEKITGASFPFTWKNLIQDALRGVRIALRNLIRQSAYTLFFLLLSLIPVLGWVAAYFILRKDWYYYGFSMLDYCCERHRMNVRESLGWIKRHNLLATINGLGFYLILLIPVLGALLAPAYASVASTIAFLELKNKE